MNSFILSKFLTIIATSPAIATTIKPISHAGNETVIPKKPKTADTTAPIPVKIHLPTPTTLEPKRTMVDINLPTPLPSSLINPNTFDTIPIIDENALPTDVIIPTTLPKAHKPPITHTI